MTGILFFNSPLDKLARAAVRFWCHMFNFPPIHGIRNQILESGSPSTSLAFNAARREGAWQNFVSGVPRCASLAKSGNTIDCLRTANTSEIFQGYLTAIAEATELFAFNPTIGGSDDLFPDIPSKLIARGHFARIPFIAGTNADEGNIFPAYYRLRFIHNLCPLGTVFSPRTINSTSQIRDAIIANFSPPLVSPSLLDNSADKLIQLYPDVPALGSPFNTGNETFGLSSVFKQLAAIG